ncbi:MAG TPA: D-alanine--D-alanine ligase family protein [Bdellovibrionota bacterium]|nr:D-alanine--D-alanine ligase family protein [Bdellovibrionota bacterium]
MAKAPTRLRVAVLYGGRSGEHEISLISAASVIRNLDPDRYEVIPVGIDKDGVWHLNSMKLIEKQLQKALPMLKDTPQVVLPPAPSDGGSALIALGAGPDSRKTVDVVFPVMHGPLCEDGTIQGLLELAGVPFVGCGVLGSALGMDKAVAKKLVGLAGLATAKGIEVRWDEWAHRKAQVLEQAKKSLPLPMFVKPVNMGSSVGVHKVKTAAELEPALEDAFRYDTKVLIEQGIAAREIELSVLENIDGGDPLVSIPGEIIPSHEFYSYESKYLDENGAKLEIPAKITPDQVKEAQRMGRVAFRALECEGMARVDLFLDKDTGRFYFNEVNTIPGFTSISMYPKLWEASGIGYSELLDRLIQLALRRHERKSHLKTEGRPGS